jgi:hypothetical protein
VYDDGDSQRTHILANGLRSMSGFKERGFNERLSTANDAKKATAAKFLQRPGADDPAFVERQAARLAVSEARDLRKAEREARRLAEEVQISAEREALAAAEAAQAAAAAEEKAAQEERAAAAKQVSDAALEVERKAARDARYAARKARK